MKIEFEMHNGFPGNLGYATFIKYFPTRFNVEEKYKANRKIVYDFKEGNYNSIVDDLFIKAINSMLNQTQKTKFWFCPIPSSTISTTQNRFHDFCDRISNKTGINNGYSLIQSSANRNQVHIGDNRDYSKVINCINFNSISGKNILLCDDVVTTGKSFKLIANHIMSLGANSVRGLMLAKTHWIGDEKKEISMIEEGILPNQEPPDVPPDLEYREPTDDFFI
jgi:predicted amidophosphoribosyltransferase